MEKKSASINLIGKSGGGVIDTFITWALNICRLIVILTEVIALSAFLYRFSLDSQLIDLHAKINQEQNTVTYYKSIEDTYRNVQKRIALAKNLSQQSDIKNRTMHDILNAITTSKLIANTFSLSDTVVKIDANVQSAVALNAFITSLKNNKHVTGVNIDSIQNKAESATILVSITVTIDQ